MDKVKTEQLVKYWQESSLMDFQTAEDIFEKTKNYVAVLFYLHLSIEKIIKAFYVYKKNNHAPFSHNLLYLSKESGLDVTEKDILLLSEINEFNLESRYPDEKFSIYKKAGKTFTGKYLKEGKKLREWISEKLRKAQ
jgi:HEPN domain-containing protein